MNLITLKMLFNQRVLSEDSHEVIMINYYLGKTRYIVKYV